MLRSLKYRIAITIFILEAVVVAAVLWQTLSHAVENSREQLESTESNAVQLAGEISRIALFTEEYDTVQTYLEKLGKRPAVLKAFLVDDRGIVVASYDFKHIGEVYWHPKPEESSYWRSFDIDNPSGKLGKLYVEFSSAQLDYIYKDALTMGVSIALAGMVLIAVVGIVLGNVLTRRLNLIVDATEKIANGNIDVRTNLSGHDEISVLGEHFDAMASRIAENKARLENANTELEKRVEERTRALTDAYHEYEIFAYSVSHDLRAPLRAMNAFGNMLMEDYGGQMDEKGLMYLDRINKNSVRMGRLIDDLLNLSKINRHSIVLEKIDLTAMCNDIKHELESASPERKVDFRIQKDVSAVGDASLVYNLLHNLLGNAWKFTRNSERARIEFSTRNKNGTTYFVVSDNGVGFDSAYSDHLFKPFQRLHGVTEFEGTGIGLSSVNRIVHRHNGEIWGEGNPGKGATFYFNLGAH